MHPNTKLYYIATTSHAALWPRGVILWWAPDHSGYSTFLEKAGKYTEAEARRIVTKSEDHPQTDWMVPVETADGAAIRVVDLDRLHELKVR
jgi:hypothetical protein